ncbi:MAG: RIP metalloprotease RseP [Cardiobacteriaceae bacterium]|nr:RIP metalloprotease RseP [Cardiobacteriaceae bacterium]
MLPMLWGILGFIITIGVLVTIHEWGHFWVARRCDVKIIRFSLGFGKPFLTWRGKTDGTLYTLAPIPLGGFVQMLGESGEEAVSEAEKNRTFKSKKAWQRFLIAFAGPAVNLIFAVLAFTILYLYGVHGLRPEVAYVSANSIAAHAGLQPGDSLHAIEGKKIQLSSDAHIALVSAPRRNDISVVIQRNGQEETLHMDLSSLRAGDELKMDESTGLYLVDEWLPANVAEVMADSPAENMGIRRDDQIIAINGKAQDLIRIGDTIAASKSGDKIAVTIIRDGKEQTLYGMVGAREYKGKTHGYLGVRWHKANVSNYESIERYDFGAALQHGWGKVIYYVRLTYNMFGRMFAGQVSLDNLGGPITIGDAAGKTLSYGWDIFLNFLGLVSLSLAAINLLPIPMLDGGHMLFYALEIVRGKPLSDKTMKWALRFGATLVYSLMFFVVLKDFWKYLLT